MNKKVIYTCLVGNYDTLNQPVVVDDTFDYLCFSNDINETKIGVWEIRNIPYETSDDIRLSRYVKLMPHEVLSEYDYSLWMDANLQITGCKFYKIVNEKMKTGDKVYQVDHCFPKCDCVYKEMEYAFSLGRSGFIETTKQFDHVRKSGFPKHWGLYENNLILRKHNDPLVIKMSNEWWQEYIHFSKRDQFSLVYVYWKNSFKPNLLFLPGENTRNVPFVKWHYHSMIKQNIVNKVIFYIEKKFRLLIWRIYTFVK